MSAEMLFGSKGAAAYRDAIEALHRFAQATGCPAGDPVTKWFDAKVIDLIALQWNMQRARNAAHGYQGGFHP